MQGFDYDSQFWLDCSGRCTYQGGWREELGGVRNWAAANPAAGSWIDCPVAAWRTGSYMLGRR